MKKIYIVWIWWIGISAIARYYNEKWYKVYWSDKFNSTLIEKLQDEWIDIIIWEDKNRIDSSFQKIVYTEAVSKNQSEISKSIDLWIEIKTYPEELSNITKDRKLITVSGTHWKSTTTSLASLILKDSEEDFTSIVWTVLKEFWWKNFFHRNNFNDGNDFFIIEACEYKRSFLNYKPSVAIITNIEIDHLDYFKDINDYIYAYEELINNVVSWWFVILNWEEENSKKITWLRDDINYITVHNNYYIHNGQKNTIPNIEMQVPWSHILYDAKLAYILWHMLWINDVQLKKSLSSYTWVWRRMETIGLTERWNILMSDYGHHPTEVKMTLEALKTKYVDKSILTIFQPHQFSRTYELMDDFVESFSKTDKLIISNIYESRDSIEDKKRINTSIFTNKINHTDKINWESLENTLKLINEYNEENSNSIILLMWAWDIDNLRKKIKTT